MKLINLFKKKEINSEFLNKPKLTKVEGYNKKPSFNETFIHIYKLNKS